jgi:hypothetical protein
MVLKIDVEGWEAEVLAGAKRVLARSGPLALIVELCEGDRYGFDEDRLDRELQRKGFTPVTYDPFERTLQAVDSRSKGGNTIYVNDVAEFSERVEISSSYAILGESV